MKSSERISLIRVRQLGARPRLVRGEEKLRQAALKAIKPN